MFNKNYRYLWRSYVLISCLIQFLLIVISINLRDQQQGRKVRTFGYLKPCLFTNSVLTFIIDNGRSFKAFRAAQLPGRGLLCQCLNYLWYENETWHRYRALICMYKKIVLLKFYLHQYFSCDAFMTFNKMSKILGGVSLANFTRRPLFRQVKDHISQTNIELRP